MIELNPQTFPDEQSDLYFTDPPHAIEGSEQVNLGVIFDLLDTRDRCYSSYTHEAPDRDTEK